MAAGDHLEKKSKTKTEMVRNAIKSDFRSSKMAQKGFPKWLGLQCIHDNLFKRHVHGFCWALDAKWYPSVRIDE